MSIYDNNHIVSNFCRICNATYMDIWIPLIPCVFWFKVYFIHLPISDFSEKNIVHYITENKRKKKHKPHYRNSSKI